MVNYAIVGSDYDVYEEYEMRFDKAWGERSKISPARYNILVDYFNFNVFFGETVIKNNWTGKSVWQDFEPECKTEILALLAKVDFNASVVSDKTLGYKQRELRRTFEKAMLRPGMADLWYEVYSRFALHGTRIENVAVRSKVSQFISLAQGFLLSCKDEQTLWKSIGYHDQEPLERHFLRFTNGFFYIDSETSIERTADSAITDLKAILKKHDIDEKDIELKEEHVPVTTSSASLAPARRQRALPSPVLRSSF